MGARARGTRLQRRRVQHVDADDCRPVLVDASKVARSALLGVQVRVCSVQFLSLDRLGFSPDHHTLAVVSVGSNSVTLIDTETNTVKAKIYVGRSPHEAFFRPDGRELWVAVRGEDYVSVIDPVKRKEVRRIETANGPGMVLFRPDGKFAFVPSSFTPEMDVVETATYKVVARVPQASPFSPNLAVDQDEVWITLKDSGKTQVVSAKAPFQTLTVFETGPITNHVAFVTNAAGRFAYVTVGARTRCSSIGAVQALRRTWSRSSRPAICRTASGAPVMETAFMLVWKTATACRQSIRLGIGAWPQFS